MEYPQNSVGLVKPRKIQFEEPLKLACGRELQAVELVYETYGELNASRDNAIMICPALTADHHAAGYHADETIPGWWENYIGPGKPVDTNRFFVVCCNNLGGCSGTTGPASIDPETGKYWGRNFPPLRVRDWVACQHKLMRSLNIEVWAAVIGGSLGGMQVLRWSLVHPDALRHAVVIASAPKLTTQNIAFNEVARQAITSDPDFVDGDYLNCNKKPLTGLAIARMVGHLTYMSDYRLAQKFGRELRDGSFAFGISEDVEFQVESYLHHQGHKFAERFDANSYLLATRVLDYFDLAREYNDDPVAAMKLSQAHFLIVAFTSDWRFSPQRSQEIVDALLRAKRPVSYQIIDAPSGHDAFLLPDKRFERTLSAYLDNIEI